MFKGAETVENVQARNNALCAAKAMDTVERIYNSLQTEANRKWNTGEMLKQTERIGYCGWQPQQKNVRKRGIEQEFPL